jgi:hypothetical protein
MKSSFSQENQSIVADGCQVQSQMQLKQLTDLLELVAGAQGMAHRRSVFFRGNFRKL